MYLFFQNCSLFKQLIIPMVLVGIVSLSMMLVSAFALVGSVGALEDLYSIGYRRIKVLQEVDKAIVNLRALSLKHLASESAKNMDIIRAEMAAIKQANNSNISTIFAHEQSAVNQGEARALDGELISYIAAIDEAVRLSADFEKEAAFTLLSKAENEHLVLIQNTMQSMTRQAFSDMSVTRAALTAATNHNLSLTIAIGLLGGGLIFGMAFVVSRQASRRITSLLAWSRRIESGDLSNALESDSGDEIGQLTDAMRGMVKGLAHGRDELINAKRDAEGAAEELRLYANAFESSGEAMLISNRENRIVNINAAFTKLTGYSLDDARGQMPRMLNSGNTPQSVIQELWDMLRDEGYWQGELWNRKKNGEIFPSWASISAIKDGHDEVAFYIASFSDISERKENEARIDYLAHHDALTGLFNRHNLENRLAQALLSAQRSERHLAVMFLDMDRFKVINDTHGHHVGDQLLIEVARRLKESVRESDIVARLGGDEFVVALTGLADYVDAAPVAEKILRALGNPYLIDDKELDSSPSIGIASYPVDGKDGSTLMRNADTAMYYAKEHGRNNIKYFTEKLNEAASERLALENDLRLAFHNGDLHLRYQPQMRAFDMRVIGVEALIRWNHPNLGEIPPLKFIPIAEESGMIEKLGDWILDEAFHQLSLWRAQGLVDIRMAVNVSAQQIRSPQLVPTLADLLRCYGLEGRDLELEITESVAMQNLERTTDQLQNLRVLGVQLAIDDFGTGYSSLASLKRLPIQTLKLDGSFVRNLETNESAAEISAATLALAHNLGLKVMAEGVETTTQRDFLLRHQCDYLQGYLFSKPLSAEEVPEFVRAQSLMPTNQ